MRHGDAIHYAASDHLRPLSQLGTTDVCAMAAWLNTQSLAIDTLLVSPYLRARQTLTLLQETLSLAPEPTELIDLVPDGNVDAVHHHLQALAVSSRQSILIVSHLPLVGELVALLCPHQRASGFTTAAIAYIDYDSQQQCGQLKWQMRPNQLPQTD